MGSSNMQTNVHMPDTRPPFHIILEHQACCIISTHKDGFDCHRVSSDLLTRCLWNVELSGRLTSTAMKSNPMAICRTLGLTTGVGGVA